jgi:hypothetical protein
MLPVAYLHHHLQGRSRLKIPAKAGDKAFFAGISERLKRHPAVRAIKSNPITGTILIHHAGEVGAISEFAQDNGLFAFSQIAGGPIGTTGTGHSADSELVLSLGFAGLGIYRMARGEYFGNAVESLWNGYQLRNFQKRPVWATIFFAIGAFQLIGGRALGQASSLLFYALTARQMSKPGEPKSTV